MRLETDEKGLIILKDVFVEITLESSRNEKIGICMRDTGFELSYVWNNKVIFFEAKEGKIIV